MLGRLVLIFIAVPLLDLVVLLRIGQVLSFWPTVCLVILTGIVGATLAKHQGLRTVAEINSELSAGRMPTSQLADGALILLAGAVLITPGFLTDLFGLLLLFAPFRRLFKKALTRYFKSRIVMTAGPGPALDPLNEPQDAGPESGPRPMKYVENEAAKRP